MRQSENERKMVKLFCVLVGAAGSAFPVDIDGSQSVGDLKDAIKGKNEDITCAPRKLHLYLAKKGDAWLPDDDPAALQLEEGGLHDDIQAMIDGEKMKATKTLQHWLFDKSKMPLPSTGQIHVLVVVPPEDVVVHPSVPVDVPTGPEVDLRSCEHLLAFLESDMTNKAAIVSSPHILAQESLQFRLVGREAAMATASKCFKNIVAFAGSTASDRTRVAIPVCSGISGLGKTRMLEEGGTILQELKLDPKHIARVIVQYFNGFSPQPVESSMPIEASFSWRLLYRFFLDKNCSLSFDKWFKSRLPRNGSLLTLTDAVDVIERKLRERLPEPATLYLFLGVDEYQKIEGVRARQTGSKTSILRELVEKIGALLCTQSSSSLVVLPMFAGTDLGVIASSSIANSSYYVTKRLPMTLLSMDQVFCIVESNAEYAGLLNHAQVCRHLLHLGGVPRWVVEYLAAVKETRVHEMPVSLDCINKCFATIWEKYVKSYLGVLGTQKLVRLAAFAVSGRLVAPTGSFDESWKWSRLRDSSLCLLIPRARGACDVRVPYALLAYLGSRLEALATQAEEAFASALWVMRTEVDEAMFNVQPWQSWEMFGACFYAVRINALLVLGHSTMTLEELLPGTRMSAATRAISVQLVSSRVVRCAGAFGASTPRLLPRKGNQLETIDWTSGGYIVVNDDGGAGVDIFFALKDAATGKDVVIVDQRKRQCGNFQSVCPDFLVASGARLVRGVMHCGSPSNLSTDVVPDDCFVVSRAESEKFYGTTLAYHPACWPVVSMNSACQTALTTVFEGDPKEVDQVVGEIMRKRGEPSGGGFHTSDELRCFIQAKRLKVQLDDQFAEFSC